MSQRFQCDQCVCSAVGTPEQLMASGWSRDANGRWECRTHQRKRETVQLGEVCFCRRVDGRLKGCGPIGPERRQWLGQALRGELPSGIILVHVSPEGLITPIRPEQIDPEAVAFYKLRGSIADDYVRGDAMTAVKRLRNQP